MSIHISAKREEVAATVLMPGDPLRAKFIAEDLLEEAVCFNRVRGMYGYTGWYGGKRISVMGSGMGMPSFSIYAHELMSEYGVKTIMRVGTCGAIQPDLRVGDIILAQAASTDSNITLLRFGGMTFAPAASFELLLRAFQEAGRTGIRVQVGGVLSGDRFYMDEEDWWKKWAAYGILACEMETNALYTLAATFKARALANLTVSDSLVTGEEASPEQRERGFTRMAELALQTVD